MIINHQYRFIFLKTRKTAGTSIEIALSKYCGDGDVISPIRGRDEGIRRERGYPGPRNHAAPLLLYDWEDLKRLARRRKRKRLAHANARFARRFVGNAIWSSYFKFCFERNPFDKAISRYYWRTLQPRPPIADFLATRSRHHLSDWETYTLDGRIAVDFIGRYERLESDLAAITERLGLPEPLDLPRAKADTRSNREHYSRVLDPRARALVENVCAREIEAFGYHWTEG